MFYCPKCTEQAIQGQRYCRKCGTNIGAIVDVMEGKQLGFNWEPLKKDFGELGKSLRQGLEETVKSIKNQTQKLKKEHITEPNPNELRIQKAVWTREFNKFLHKVKLAHSRRYSFQQAALNLLGGGASFYAWRYFLTSENVLGVLETAEEIFRESGRYVSLEGLLPIITKLYWLALIPMVKGGAHLINGIFFPPNKIEKLADVTEDVIVIKTQPEYPEYQAAQPQYQYAETAPITNSAYATPSVPVGITEDETMKLDSK